MQKDNASSVLEVSRSKGLVTIIQTHPRRSRYFSRIFRTRPRGLSHGKTNYICTYVGIYIYTAREIPLINGMISGCGRGESRGPTERGEYVYCSVFACTREENPTSRERERPISTAAHPLLHVLGYICAHEKWV